MTDTQSLDAEVVALVRRGQATVVLQWLMCLHGPSVYRYCRDALHDPTLAEDIHQQVFIAVHRALPSFEGRSSVRAWLFGIARHRVLDAAKARSRERARVAKATADEPATGLDPGPPADEALDDMRLRSALGAELALLSEPVRATLALRFQHGLSIAEVAAVLNELPGTTSARIQRAMPGLRERIEARLHGRSRGRSRDRISATR